MKTTRTKTTNPMQATQDVYDEMREAKEFIYEIKGKCYVMGMVVFRRCSNRERALYEAFIKEFDQIKGRLQEPERRQQLVMEKRLSDIEKKIWVAYSIANEAETRKKLEAFMGQLTEEEILSLHIQRLKYRAAVNYSAGWYFRL